MCLNFFPGKKKTDLSLYFKLWFSCGWDPVFAAGQDQRTHWQAPTPHPPAYPQVWPCSPMYAWKDPCTLTTPRSGLPVTTFYSRVERPVGRQRKNMLSYTVYNLCSLSYTFISVSFHSEDRYRGNQQVSQEDWTNVPRCLLIDKPVWWNNM